MKKRAFCILLTLLCCIPFILLLSCTKEEAHIVDTGKPSENPTIEYDCDPFDWTVDNNKEQVVLFVKRSTYSDIQEYIQQYKLDVEEKFPVQLNIVTGTWSKAIHVRETIKNLYETKDLKGVILVGDMPMHKFYMHDFANPNPLYYEDFLLQFNHDEVANKYDGVPDLKIWVANIRAESSPDLNGVDKLKKFFKKTHLYYSNQLNIKHKALFVAGWEWPEGAKSSAEAVKNIFSGHEVNLLINETGVDSGNESLGATKTNIINAFKDNYLFYYIQVHSYEKGHDLENGGKLLATEIENMPTGALFVVNHGCSAGNWLKASPDVNTSQAYVFGSSIGQAVVCQVRTGMVYGHEIMYERIVAGDYIGKAYFEAKKVAEDDMYREYPNGDIFSGVVFIGNPFIYIK